MNAQLPPTSIRPSQLSSPALPWHRRRARVVATGLGLLSAVALAACGTTSPKAAPATAGNGSPPTIPSGSKGPTLIVYAAEGYDSAMTKAFQKATGIVTKLDDDSTGPLLAKVQAEINNPQWGLLWVDGDDAFAELDNEHYLVKDYLPYNPSTDLNATGQSVVPPDHSYIPTGVTTMPAVVGPVGQVQSSVLAAARVHGATWARAWRSTMLPLLSGGILWAWLYGFGGTVFELPISQLLYPPGHQTLSVSINNLLSTYYFGTGTATMVVAVGATLLVIGAILGLFRLVTPAGWRQRGGLQ